MKMEEHEKKVIKEIAQKYGGCTVYFERIDFKNHIDSPLIAEGIILGFNSNSEGETTFNILCDDGNEIEVEAEELYASKDVLIKKMTKDLSKALGCLKDM